MWNYEKKIQIHVYYSNLIVLHRFKITKLYDPMAYDTFANKIISNKNYRLKSYAPININS